MSEKGDTEILEHVRANLKLAQDAMSDSRQSQLDDLRFLAGSPDNNWQWPSDVLANRSGANGQSLNARPTLTVNMLPQHVLQVTNDMRQNAATAKVVPANDKAAPEVAEMLNGVIRHVEYMSNADICYQTAQFNQVAYGEGYVRLLTDYVSEREFEQDIKLQRVRNSFSVYMDPEIQDPCGQDARWCIITCQMNHEEFEREYPKAKPLSSLELGVGDDNLQMWISNEYVTVAEYFYYEDKTVTICLFDFDGEKIVAEKDSAQYKIIMARGVVPVRERETTIKNVMWCKTNGYEILDQKEWAGRWIPVVRFVGNEYDIEGKLHISGLVRNSKDPQRMYNYWVSQEAEMLAMAPKAPFVGYLGQFDGQEAKWKSANVQNWPYLEVNPTVDEATGQVLPLPQRAMPPMPQTAIIQAKMGAADDVKKVTGQYNPSLGQQGNETSGRAIIAREQQADTGTFHYQDNSRHAIRFVALQLVDLIPKIYDTKRIARIVGEDGKSDNARIDPMQEVPYREVRDENGAIIEKIYNPNIGRYDVIATTGPSYNSKRIEAANAQSQLLQANPDLWKIAGDLFVKNLDWPGADQLAKRLERVVPPELKGDGDESPEVAQAKKMIQALQQENQQMMSLLENAHKSIEAQDAQAKQIANQIKAYEAETKRIQALQSGMTPEQVQDTVMGTMDAMISNGELEAAVQGQPMQQQPMPPQGMPIQ